MVDASTHDLAGLAAKRALYGRTGGMDEATARMSERRYRRSNRLREELDLTADALGLPCGMAADRTGRTLVWPGRDGRGLVVVDDGGPVVVLRDVRAGTSATIDRRAVPWERERAEATALLRGDAWSGRRKETP